MKPALDMFNELLNDTALYEHEKETPWANMGHFMRSEVRLFPTPKNLFF